MADTFLNLVDSVLFFGISLSGIYLFIFALASMFKRTDSYPKADKKHRFVILVPIGTTLLAQKYPEELYNVLPYEKLPETIQELDKSYDMVVILGENSLISPRLLQEINDVYSAGVTALQLHHIIENRSTQNLRKQALFEEINHAIFKQGHTRLGLSSTLDGTDMAIELKYLQKNLKSPKSNMERRLLRQHIFIEYLAHTTVSSPASRTRIHTIPRKKIVSDLPEAILTGNWDYADKLFQRLLPSWKTLLVINSILAMATTWYDWSLSLKWWGGLFCLLLTISFAIPDYLVEKKKRKHKNREI